MSPVPFLYPHGKRAFHKKILHFFCPKSKFGAGKGWNSEKIFQGPLTRALFQPTIQAERSCRAPGQWGERIPRMRSEEALAELNHPEFLDALYGFAYRRCRSSHEAEDLCSDILLAILQSIRRQAEIRDFYPYVWSIARRTYADFSRRRREMSDRLYTGPAAETGAYDADRGTEAACVNPIEDYLDREADAENLRRILREIAFLSKIYRDVMVLYYLDGIKTPAIAGMLGIPETTVRQRLHIARGTIQKEVEKVKATEKPAAMTVADLALKPMQIHCLGTGNPIGNDPREKAERMFSQNVVYFCKDAPRSAGEIAERLHVPMPFVEEELDIQCRGSNGEYGLLRRLDNGKYQINFLLLDLADYRAVTAAYEDELDALTDTLRRIVTKRRDELLSFPFLNRQTDPRFILWSLISPAVWSLEGAVRARLKETSFAAVAPPDRPFTVTGVALPEGEEFGSGFYGCDGISGRDLGGYAEVFLRNIYGERITQQFHCGHDIANDPLILLTLRSIGGLPVAGLSDDERETAAKAIEAGYLRREGGILEPRILTMRIDDQDSFSALRPELGTEARDSVERIAGRLAGLADRLLPAHLRNEYPAFTLLSSCALTGKMIERCIQEGLLSLPGPQPGPEGVCLFVRK